MDPLLDPETHGLFGVGRLQLLRRSPMDGDVLVSGAGKWTNDRDQSD